MAKIFLILILFLPVLTSASVASDFTVNPQPAYDVPPGTTDLLILDLTLPAVGLKSIKIINAGTLQHADLNQLSVFEDGNSAGWDGDEKEIIRKSSSPFWDTDLSGEFSKQRIFVTVSATSTVFSGKTVQPELALNSMVFSKADFNGPTDKKITGLERKIVAGVSAPSIPVSPMILQGEALSSSAIRWYFTDLSNNEFGFKIIDGNLKEVARKEEANLSYLDETGLQPDTEYSSRKLFAFNDRGVSLTTSLTIFSAVKTLAQLKVEEVQPQTTPAVEEVRPPEEVVPQAEVEPQIAIRQQIIEILTQLIQLFQERIKLLQASVFGAFESLTGWLETLF